MSTPVASHRAAPAYPYPTSFQPLDVVVRTIHARIEAAGLARPYVVEDPDGKDWISGTSLVDGSALPSLLRGPTVLWGAAPHAAAALAWKAYTYWLTLPAVVGLVHAERVPLLHPDNVLVRLSHGPPYVTVGLRRPTVAVLPGDPYAVDPDVMVVDDTDGLLRVLADGLGGHITQLAAATRAQVRIGARTLAGSLAASVGYSLQFAATAFDGTGPVRPATYGEAILDALGVTDLIELDERPDGSIDVRRRTCCLAFTVPGLETCASCCITRRS